MRSIVPTLSLSLALLCGACSSLSSDERSRLADHQRNAATYYESGRFNQALVQIDKGLELEPGDYKLTMMRGFILLRLSGDTTSTDHARLDEATALFAELYETRSPSRHEPQLLLSYGLAKQKQGRRHLGESVRLQGQASRTADPATTEQLREQASIERARADGLLQEAAALFDVLIERGELTRIAHSHRMQVARDLGDDARFVAEAEKYLEQCDKAQKAVQARIDSTLVAPYEADQWKLLEALKQEELAARRLIAAFHYEKQQLEAALVHLHRVIELDPRSFPDYFNRGEVLVKLGRIQEAKSDLQRFLADPSLPPTSDKVTFAVKVLDK